MPNDLKQIEELILEKIREHPLISQQALTEIAGTSKSSIANIISDLIRKGYITGESFSVNETSPIVCIGGANVDRKFYSKGDLTTETSNPVNSSSSVGGVARNIAENLGRLGEEVALLSASGYDASWNEIYDLSSPYMNLEHVAQFEDAATGSYTAVLDKHGDLSIALADMDVYDRITPELMMKNKELLNSAKCIVADLNCPKETIDYISAFTAEHQIPFIVIPVSTPKMDRLPEKLDTITWLIANNDETETYFNMEIHDQASWEESVQKWLALGIENVIVTNGSKGVMVGDSGGIRYFPVIDTPRVVDVTGAGDSFCSGVIYSWLQNKDIDYIIKSGLVNASKTIMSKYTVRQELSKKQLKIDMEAI